MAKRIAKRASSRRDLAALRGRERQLGVSREMLFDWLLATARQQMAASRRTQSALVAPDDWRKWQAYVRKRMIASIGGLPKRTPLNARVVGSLDLGDCRVDKLIYESRPGFYVTANLYVPNRAAQKLPAKARLPAALVPCGHTDNGKVGYQDLHVSLAKKGFISLGYDPLGQGERSEYIEAKTGRDTIRIGTAQHAQAGNVCYLTGRGLAHYRVWDAIRSIDYLCSRDDVDPKRIGVMGSSGGGTLTTFLAAIDDRVAAAAPGCYITTLIRRMLKRDAADPEQNLPDTLMWGIDHAEMLSPLAPKPLMILCAQDDFFPILGTLESFSHLQTVYAGFGSVEKLSLGWNNAPHGLKQEQRERAYAWFLRWLGDAGRDWREPPHKRIADKDLCCTKTGQVQTALGGQTSWSLNKKRADQIRPKRSMPTSAADVRSHTKAIRAAIPKVLALPDRLPAIKATEIGRITRRGLVIEKIAIASEKGVIVPALLFRPRRVRRGLPAVLHVDEDGKASAARSGGLVDRLAGQGWLVLSIDPRGIGETKSGHEGTGRASYYGWYGTEAEMTYESFMIGRPMLGLRVLDTLQALKYLRRRKDVDAARISMLGHGYGGTIALFAAALDGRIASAAAIRSLVSYRVLIDNPYYKANVGIMLPDVIRHMDLPDLAAAVAPRPLLLIDSYDHRRRLLPTGGLRVHYDRAVQSYDVLDSATNLRLIHSTRARSPVACVIDWLAT